MFMKGLRIGCFVRAKIRMRALSSGCKIGEVDLTDCMLNLNKFLFWILIYHCVEKKNM